MKRILKSLEKQEKIEQKAADLYTEIAEKISGPTTRKTIERIRDDELYHVKIVEGMIKLLKTHKGTVKIKKQKPSELGLEGIADEFGSAFVITKLENLMKTIETILKEVNKPCVYLSFNKLPKYLRKNLASRGINTNRIRFVECVKGSSGPDPEDLTKISVTLGGMLNKTGGDLFVLVDSITGFSVYHNANMIAKFVSVINSKVEKAGHGIVWVAILNDTEQDLINKLCQLCDKEIKT